VFISYAFVLPGHGTVYYATGVKGILFVQGRHQEVAQEAWSQSCCITGSERAAQYCPQHVIKDLVYIILHDSRSIYCSEQVRPVRVNASW